MSQYANGFVAAIDEAIRRKDCLAEPYRFMVEHLRRNKNAQPASFETRKSNDTKSYDTGSASMPSVVFDRAGPHLRNFEDQDLTF